MAEVFETGIEETEFEQVESKMVVGEVEVDPVVVEVVEVESGDEREVEVQLEHDLGLHFDQLLEGVAVIGDVDEVVEFGEVYFRQFARDHQRGHSHQLELLSRDLCAFDYAVQNADCTEQSLSLKVELQVHFHHPVDQD